MRLNPRRLAMCGTVLAVLICGTAIAQTTTAPHDPYTIKGFLVRGEIQVGIPEPFGAIVPDMGPVAFQEIAPCTLVSTLESDNYPAPWGGPKFVPFESRTYPSAGLLANANWVNPCSGQIPAAAKALALRIHAVNPSNAGMFSVSWGEMPPSTGIKALEFTPAVENSMEEAGVMLNPAGRFTLAVTDATTDAVVEVLGYFVAAARQTSTPTGISMWTVEGTATGPCALSAPVDAVAVACQSTGEDGQSASPKKTGASVIYFGCNAVNVNGCVSVYSPGPYKVTFIGPTAP